MKKSVIAMITAVFAAILTLSGCAGAAQPPEGLDAAQPPEQLDAAQNTVYEIASEDSFLNCGFTCWVCDATGSYNVSADSGSEDVTWSVYVLEEEFEDADRYIAQAHDPVLEGSGTLSLTEGQYVYVKCGANDFTADGPVDGGRLIISAE